jgi:Transglycosylase
MLLYKILLGLAVLFLFAVTGLCGWLFLYTGDLPDVGHLSEFAPTQTHLATDTCLAGTSFVVPFDRIGKRFRDAFASAEPSLSLPDQIARTLMCDRPERMARYQLNVLRLSWHIRRHFSKQELFTIYVNRAYFGPGTTGIQNASEHLFGKDASNLTVGEAALLAGLLRSPARFNPSTHPEDAQQRRNEILEAMATQGKLSATEAVRAKGTPIITGHQQ